MKYKNIFLIEGFIISLIIHSLLIFGVLSIFKKKTFKIPTPPKQVIVDIITLPRKAHIKKSTVREKHKIAANISRPGKAKIFSKIEKIPFGAQNKKQKIITIPKVKKLRKVARSKIKHKIQNSKERSLHKATEKLAKKVIPKKTITKTKEFKNKTKTQPEKIVKLNGNLFNNSISLNEKFTPKGFEGGSSKQYEYKKTTKREATISIGTQSIKYASYLEHIKNKIQNVWIYPSEAAQTGQQGRLLIFFSISKNGDLIFLKLIHSSGYTLLDKAALSAVKEAAPFPPLPKRFNLDRLNIYATFEYRLGYYFIE